MSKDKKPVTPAAQPPAGTTQAVAKTDKPELVTRQEIRFKELAYDIIKGTMEVGRRYLSLCQYARAEKLAKKVVTKWLLDLGFHKSKASEIVRVCGLSDKDFSLLEAQQIGWRGALQLSRGNLKEIAKDAGNIAPEVQEAVILAEKKMIEDEEAKQDTEAEKLAKTPEEAAKDKAATLLQGLNEVALRLLTRAEKLSRRVPRKWNNGNGWQLTLTPCKTRDQIKADAANAANAKNT